MSEAEAPRFGVEGLKPTFTYQRDGEPHMIFMSFGLLNILMQAIGNYGNLGLVGVDPQINEMLLKKFFVKRLKSGKPSEYLEPLEEGGKPRLMHELEDLYDIDVSPEDVERALFFIQCHMADFMLRTLKNAAGVNKDSQAAQEKLKALSSSMSGPTGSPA